MELFLTGLEGRLRVAAAMDREGSLIIRCRGGGIDDICKYVKFQYIRFIHNTMLEWNDFPKPIK